MTVKVDPAHSFTYDGAMVNIFFANKGQGLPRHEHIYSHATFCVSGSCIVRKEAKEIILTKTSQPLNLRFGEWHEIEALENETVFINIFAEGKG